MPPLRRARTLALSLVAAATLLGGARPARAEASLPIIAAGREKDVMALIKPYQLGSKLPDGWHLENVNITGTFIRLLALGPNNEMAAVRLELPARAPSSETTKSFAVHRELQIADGGAKVDGKVLDSLVEAVRKNDDGKFWPAKGPTVPVFDGPKAEAGPNGGATGAKGTGTTSGSVVAPGGDASHGFASLRRLLLGGGLALIVVILLLGRVRGEKKES